MSTHSSILARRIPMDRGAWRAVVHGVAKSPTGLSDFYFHRCINYLGVLKISAFQKGLFIQVTLEQLGG